MEKRIQLTLTESEFEWICCAHAMLANASSNKPGASSAFEEMSMRLMQGVHLGIFTVGLIDSVTMKLSALVVSLGGTAIIGE